MLIEWVAVGLLIAAGLGAVLMARGRTRGTSGGEPLEPPMILRGAEPHDVAPDDRGSHFADSPSHATGGNDGSGDGTQG